MSDHSRPADRGIFHAFLALLVWLPLPVGSNRPWAEALMLLWLALLAIAWLWRYQAGRVDLTPAFLRARWVVVLFVLWLAWLGLQLMPLPEGWLQAISPFALSRWLLVDGGNNSISVDPQATLRFLLKALGYFLVFALTLLLLRSRRRIRLLLYVLVISGAFQAVYGGLMAMSGLEWGFLFKKDTYTGVASGTYINRNHLAGYLELCLAAGIGLLLANLGDGVAINWRQRLRDLLLTLLGPKLRLRVLLAVMVIGLVLTHSRMGNSAFFASMLIAGGLWIVATGHRPKGSALLLLASLFLVDLVIVGNWFGVEKVVERLENTSASHETRDEVVRDGLQMLPDLQLTGSGGGAYYTTYPAYRQGDVVGFYNHAHNDYLELFSDTGVVGGLLLGLALAVSLFVGLWALFKRNRRLLRGAAFAAFMGQLSLLIHSSVDFNLQIPANAATFSVLLALGWVAGFHGRGGEV